MLGTGEQKMPSDRDIQKDRLIELLKKADDIASKKLIMDYDDAIADNADYLLANGVIVPPCKVGQTLWILFTIEKTIESREIESIIQSSRSWTIRFTNGDCFTVWDNAEDEYFGKTVFLTKEEAEQALKE